MAAFQQEELITKEWLEYLTFEQEEALADILGSQATPDSIIDVLNNIDKSELHHILLSLGVSPDWDTPRLDLVRELIRIIETGPSDVYSTGVSDMISLFNVKNRRSVTREQIAEELGETSDKQLTSLVKDLNLDDELIELVARNISNMTAQELHRLLMKRGIESDPSSNYETLLKQLLNSLRIPDTLIKKSGKNLLFFPRTQLELLAQQHDIPINSNMTNDEIVNELLQFYPNGKWYG